MENIIDKDLENLIDKINNALDNENKIINE